MIWFRQLPIAAKLRVIIMVASLTMVAVTCAIWVGYENHTIRTALPPAQLVRYRIVASNVTAALGFNYPRDAQEILAGLRADEHVREAVILDDKGQLFAQYSAPGVQWHDLMAPSSEEGFRYGPDRLVVWTPVRVGTRTLGMVAGEVDLLVITGRLHAILLITVAVMLVAGLASFWLAGALQGIISAPILDLERAAARVTEHKDYSVRVPRVSDDEIGRLTDAFNAMLAAVGESNAAADRLYEQVRRHAGELELRVKERTVQLQDANDELEAFGSSVSHDLRGPLRYIDGYAQMLLDDHSGQLDAEGRDFLLKIIDRASKMNGLINVLLEFSRLNRAALRVETLDLGRMSRDVFAELMSEAPGRQVRLEVGALPPCQGDPALMRLVLVNLLSNAVKYTRGREVAVIEVGAAPAAAGTEYFVRDNGIGFDPAKAGKLFVAFERLHDARQYEGTGIGLATVKRIIQRHGGQIRAESALNVGTTFYFTVPSLPHDR